MLLCTERTEHSKPKKIVDTMVCVILHNMSIRARQRLHPESPARLALEEYFAHQLEQVEFDLGMLAAPPGGVAARPAHASTSMLSRLGAERRQEVATQLSEVYP